MSDALNTRALQVFREAYASRSERADLDGDGAVTIRDLIVFKAGAAATPAGPASRNSPGGTARAPAEVFIDLSPVLVEGEAGNPFTVDVTLDFTLQPTLGGALDVVLAGNLNATLDWTYDTSTIGDDPVFRNPPTIEAGQLTGIAVGNFDGISGPGIVGTITITPQAGGAGTLTPGESALSPWVANDTFEIQTPQYAGSQLTIDPHSQPVPVSAAALVALGAMLWLVGASARTAVRPQHAVGEPG